MSTRRERLQARAAQRREWAAKREAKRDVAWEQAHQIAHDIPLGQPILVGHHSERGMRRIYETIDRKGFEGLRHHEMATHHTETAINIEHALARSIYDDDPDAIEQLESRLANLEAERERIKAYNASCRKGAPDVSLLRPEDLRTIELCMRFGQSKRGEFPSYALSNLNGNIKRQHDRLARLRTEAAS